MTITDAAEQVLFGKTLEQKLELPAPDLPDQGKRSPMSTPSTPTRPSELTLSEAGVRAQFPGTNLLDQQRPRGELLHFLANHELLASELMALVLLKFPNAPTEYRREVYKAMREEQMHTRMYLRRMKECGVEFGQLPLNSYFWRLVSPMKSPMEFVTKLNLTFEQANLDFSHHYAQKFRQVGDTGTAAVLEKIYQDEIGHVGHGIKWLRTWKNPKKSDWETYNESLSLPFSASKAKGLAPYNPEGRRKAGLNDEFITKLSVYSQSRGRNPVLHWFNPNAETAALATHQNTPYTPTKTEQAIATDLELLMLAMCKQDDMLLLRQLPTTEHLTTLNAAGFQLPELVSETSTTLQNRKLGGLIPWAWSPDASTTLKPLKKQIPLTVPHQWKQALPPICHSKSFTLTLHQKLNLPTETQLLTSKDQALENITKSPNPTRLKPPFSCSGRGHLTYTPGKTDKAHLTSYLTKIFKAQGAIIIEPEREKICDFSVHYDLEAGKPIARLKGYCVIENTTKGQFTTAHVSKKWTTLLPKGIPAFLYKETNFTSLYNDRIPLALASLLPSYTGPIGIDAFIYTTHNTQLALNPIVEVNVRHTMGRIALELLRKQNNHKGALTILPKKATSPLTSIPLNDPQHVRVLQAYWNQ